MPTTGTDLASTKLVVDDLEAMADYYGAVYGFTQAARVQAAIGGEPIDEVLLSLPGRNGFPLVLMRYTERSTPPTGEVALVFTTDDIDALFDRIVAHGGSVHVAPFQSEVVPFRAGFAHDPEGHLVEHIEQT
jgi:predicted enzyme related to lactoylglutathione lyase